MANAQFGIEANYGLNGSYDPSYNGFTHFGAGITYDFDETFGAKIDFGMDEFSIQNDVRAMKTGTTNTRISAQGVINLSALADSRSSYNKFNILAHGGAGVSILKSDIEDYPNTDHLFNVVLGLTPRFEISEKLFSLRTNGGSEFCGAVIGEATKELKWDDGKNNMKLVYIAGNEAFNQGGINYKEAISTALKNNIYIKELKE